MAKVIALYGAANTGKTTTLNKLIVWLGGRIDTRIDNHELLEVFNHRVFVATDGDFGGAVEENFRRFEEMGADVFVLASRTRGSTVETIQNHTTLEEITWMEAPGLGNNTQNGCVLDIFGKIYSYIIDRQ